jgi:hypothetical protein
MAASSGDSMGLKIVTAFCMMIILLLSTVIYFVYQNGKRPGEHKNSTKAAPTGTDRTESSFGLASLPRLVETAKPEQIALASQFDKAKEKIDQKIEIKVAWQKRFSFIRSLLSWITFALTAAISVIAAITGIVPPQTTSLATFFGTPTPAQDGGQTAPNNVAETERFAMQTKQIDNKKDRRVITIALFAALASVSQGASAKLEVDNKDLRESVNRLYDGTIKARARFLEGKTESLGEAVTEIERLLNNET